MLSRWLAGLCAGACLQASAQSGVDKPLLMLVEQRPALIELINGGLQGVMGVRAEAVLRASGLRYQFEHSSVEQQLERVRSNKEALCALGRVRTAERSQLGQLSAPFYASQAYVAVVRGDADWVQGAPFLKDWSQNPKLRWGVKQGYFYDEYIGAKMRSAQAQKRVFGVDNAEVGELLRRKEIDFVLMHRDEAQLLMVAQPLSGGVVEVLRLHDLLEGEFRYFYCSRSVSRAQMDLLNQGIRQAQDIRPN